MEPNLPSSSRYLIRRPELEDADELGALHVQIWRDTYPGMMAQSVLDGLDPSKYAAGWRRIAERAAAAELAYVESGGRDGTLTRIAVHTGSGELAGFATAGAARDDDAPVHRQLYAINVVAAHQGSGVAQRLLDAVLGGLPGYLWVAQDNLRAQTFYRRNGFVADGGQQRDEDLGCDEIRMVRAGPATLRPGQGR